MKKVTTMAIIGGKEKQISVYLEEELADWLDTIDEATRRDFIVREWKVALSERAETRRHNSLERLTEAGWDIADDTDVQAEVERRDDRRQLADALAKLKPQQRSLLAKVYADGMSLKQIGRTEGVSKEAIYFRLQVALKKLRKNFCQKA